MTQADATGRADIAGAAATEADRVALLATLARPLQHDINNLLTVVYANLEMLRRSAAEGAPRRQLDRVEEAARRIDAGSRAYLSLARRPPGQGPDTLSLSDAVGALRPLLMLLLPSPGLLVVDLEPEGWPARLDRPLLDTALLRLAAAAQDATAPPRTERLALLVTNRPGGGTDGRDAVELGLRCLVPAPPEAQEALARLAEAAGGIFAATEGGTLLRLVLPRESLPATR